MGSCSDRKKGVRSAEHQLEVEEVVRDPGHQVGGSVT